MLKLIFVCKDNLTRSVSAELATQKYLLENNISDVVVSSAGIDLGHFEKIYTAHFEELGKMGLSEQVAKHQQKLLAQEMIDPNTLVIARK